MAPLRVKRGFVVFFAWEVDVRLMVQLRPSIEDSTEVAIKRMQIDTSLYL